MIKEKPAQAVAPKGPVGVGAEQSAAAGLLPELAAEYA